jgi:endonuclease YncB( thermonuclease family)
MAAIGQRNGLTVGIARLGQRAGGTGSVAQQVHDGDTVSVRPDGNLSVRFLGVDAPEVSFTLPAKPDRFIAIDDPAWEEFLTDPLADDLPAFDPPLGEPLTGHLAAATGAGCAANHARHAEAAHRELEALMNSDMAELGQDVESFRLFQAFAREITDGYGRLLCYLNRQQDDPRRPAPRPVSYNERLMRSGHVTPYFIWPNINPFRRQAGLVAAVPRPGTAAELAERDPSLRQARAWVRQARADRIGLYDRRDPLRLQPFELRFLARTTGERRTPPERWVIDLSRSDDTLIPPRLYPTVANPEDRLFVPAEYLALFTQAGWRIPTD